MNTRPVVLQVSVLSLDGYVVEEGTQAHRLTHGIDDPERDEWMVASLWRAGHHVMGRVTYESMAAYWPTASNAFAEVMNAIPKVAFSRTLQRADWTRSQIARGDTGYELDQLKKSGEGEIIAHGGAQFARSLASHDLVDEYRLIVFPIVAGGGTPLFGGVDRPRAVRLVSQSTFPSGCTATVLRRAE